MQPNEPRPQERRDPNRLAAASDFTVAEKRQADDVSPARLRARVLSGAELWHYVPTKDYPDFIEYRKFRIDLASVRAASTLIVDYNHCDDEERILGKAENLTLETDGLYADITIYPKRPGDVASSVAFLAQYVPFGISPTVAFEQAVRVERDDELIFENLPILGLAICPYPTDIGTYANLLKRTELKMDENKPTDAAAETSGVKNQELADFIDACGDVAAGVEAYQAGKSLEEAKDERLKSLIAENERLKNASAPSNAETKSETDDAENATSGESKTDDKNDGKLSNQPAARLAAALESLSSRLETARVAALSAHGEEPASAGTSRGDDARDYVAQLSACCARRGV
ncbi:MAG: hypothetical protein IKK39_16540 [Thermoguttaceae bacterium]|nr:hypothetical protein [Thermoguttaceae bacterium]